MNWRVEVRLRAAAGGGVNSCGGNGESECALVFSAAWLGGKDSVIK